jgi:uncharacterized OB-fold protein
MKCPKCGQALLPYRDDLVCPKDRGGCGAWFNVVLKDPEPGTSAGEPR